MSRPESQTTGTTQVRPEGLLRSVLLWSIYLIVTIPVVLFACLMLLLAGGDAAHRVHLWWCRLTVWLLRIRVVVVNPERIVRHQPVVFFSNHQSILDIVVCGSVLQRQYRWLAKSELFKIPVLGWGMRRTGYIPVERGHGERARRSFYAAAERVANGESIIVFPEGTVTPDGKLLPFRRGGFIIAQRAGVQIQCLSISGTFHLLPDQVDRKIPRYRSGEVRVFVHEPIPAHDLAGLDAADVMQRARTLIESQVRV